MRNWNDRPKEISYLLNPSFCGFALASSAFGYMENKPEGVLLPILYIILPIVLHKPTRVVLPRDFRTSLPIWIQRNADIRIGFYERTIEVKPYTNESIRFSIAANWGQFNSDGFFQANNIAQQLRLSERILKNEAGEIIKRAHFIGRWFSRSGDHRLIMSLFGVKP
jgi:hypothetical protein